MKLYIYTFEDDTNMKIVNCPLTVEQVLTLERVHGECIADVVETMVKSEEQA